MRKLVNGILQNIQLLNLSEQFYLWQRFSYSGFLNLWLINYGWPQDHSSDVFITRSTTYCIKVVSGIQDRSDQTISSIFSDPIQINGLKLLDDHSEVSLQHLTAIDRRTINLMGEVTAKTFPIRIKKECIFNVSTSSIYELRFAVIPSYCEPQGCRLRGARSRSNAH